MDFYLCIPPSANSGRGRRKHAWTTQRMSCPHLGIWLKESEMGHDYWVAMAVQLMDDQWTSTQMHGLTDRRKFSFRLMGDLNRTRGVRMWEKGKPPQMRKNNVFGVSILLARVPLIVSNMKVCIFKWSFSVWIFINILCIFSQKEARDCLLSSRRE